MSATREQLGTSAGTAAAHGIDMKLEVVVIPVSDVDRAKRFYGSLGWRLDADFARGEEFRLVQFTPPGSSCSIHFGTGVTSAAPGSAAGLYLVVSEIEATRADLVARGIDVSCVFHRDGRDRVNGPDPARRSPSGLFTFPIAIAERAKSGRSRRDVA